MLRTTGVIFLLVSAAFGQVDTGTIRLTLTAQTGSEGSYIFTPLHAGRYSVSVTMSGFGKEIKNGITLDVHQSAQ